MTRILACSCSHDGQDKLHGKGQRVHNLCRKDGKATGWRCTVCTSVKSTTKGDK